ncbi:Hypothetical protein D9617_18g034750 [Elsinoe fawcettii]|nr:Hypothetical protein D9617_18g034750 [Elsinoe fawcettii]
MHAVRQAFGAKTMTALRSTISSKAQALRDLRQAHRLPLPLQSQTTSSTPLPLETIAPGTASSFSGKSFAAGFVPGILLGAALLFGIIFSLARRRRKREEVTEITIPPGGAGGLSSAKSAFGRRKNRRQISDPVVQPQFSTRTAFYHSSSPSKPCSDISASTATSVLDSSNAEKALPIPHSRKRSSSTYDTNTMGYPATPFSHTASDFHVNSLFHQSPNPNNPTTTPMPPPPPPIDSSPTPKGSITPPNPLRNKKSQGSLRRQLSRFRKTSAPSPGVVSRTSSKRRRVGSWSSGDDRSLSGDERNGRESRGTIRVVMSPPRQGPLPMGFGPVLRANMPPPSWAGIASQQTGEQEGGGMKNILPSGMAYGHTDLPYPERVQANSGEKRAGQGAYTLGTPPQAPGQGFLGSPYTPSKNGGKAGQVLGANRQTTFGEMMERAGVERRDLDRARGALYGK